MSQTIQPNGAAGPRPSPAMALAVAQPQPQRRGIAQAPAEPSLPQITVGFGNLQSFELIQRIAKMFASSALVPEAYRLRVRKRGRNTDDEFEENPSAIPNCVIALNMAERLKADPLMVMQNLHIVEGRPSWSAQFMVAAANSCGRFTPIKYRVTRGEEREVEYVVAGWRDKRDGSGKRERFEETKKATVPDLRCVAYAKDKATGEELESPEVSIEMALHEGWYQRAGSKWQGPLREQMIRYRAATFFCRLYSPELLMGLPSTDEVVEILEAERDAQGGWSVPDADAMGKAMDAAQAEVDRAQAGADADGVIHPQQPAQLTQDGPGIGLGLNNALDPAVAEAAGREITEAVRKEEARAQLREAIDRDFPRDEDRREEPVTQRPMLTGGGGFPASAEEAEAAWEAEQRAKEAGQQAQAPRRGRGTRGGGDQGGGLPL